MLSRDTLPTKLLPPCLDLLDKLLDERDLIRVVVEVINELRDPGEDEEELPVVRIVLFLLPSVSLCQTQNDGSNFGETPATVKPARQPKSREDLSPEAKAHADEIDLRCLSMCIGMLERVNSVSHYIVLKDLETYPFSDISLLRTTSHWKVH